MMYTNSIIFAIPGLCCQVTLVGNSTAWSTASSPMGRCPRTRPSGGATTLSTPSSRRPVSSLLVLRDGRPSLVFFFVFEILLICCVCTTTLFSDQDDARYSSYQPITYFTTQDVHVQISTFVWRKCTYVSYFSFIIPRIIRIDLTDY